MVRFFFRERNSVRKTDQAKEVKVQPEEHTLFWNAGGRWRKSVGLKALKHGCNCGFAGNSSSSVTDAQHDWMIWFSEPSVCIIKTKQFLFRTIPVIACFIFPEHPQGFLSLKTEKAVRSDAPNFPCGSRLSRCFWPSTTNRLGAFLLGELRDNIRNGRWSDRPSNQP